MHRALALVTICAIAFTACGSADEPVDVVASVQIDEDHDVVAIRSDQDDLTPVLRVCRVPHGDPGAANANNCVEVDPFRWLRSSISASLDPGPSTSLVVVHHHQARFDIVQPWSLQADDRVKLYLPTEPLGTMVPMVLSVVVARSELSTDNAIGCLDTGLADGANPVFISAGAAPSDPDPAPGPGSEAAIEAADADGPVPTPLDLQTACV